MALWCHMKEKIAIVFLKFVFVTIVGVNNSDSFMVKTQTGFLKSSVFCSAWVTLLHQSLGCTLSFMSLKTVNMVYLCSNL